MTLSFHDLAGYVFGLPAALLGGGLSTPVIWVIVPILAAVLFWFLRHRERLVILLAMLLCLLLALLAWLVPLDQLIRLGPLSLTINSTLEIAGRKLTLNNGDRTFLVFIYFLCAYWFTGSLVAGANRLLVPFGLGMAAMLVAAQAVEPFLYAALLVETAVLLAIPILAPPGELFGQGVLRFLIFQTLAMPFILLAGWALAGVEANPANMILVTFASVFLGLGFAFWLAVFPFYTWIPLLAEQSFPYATGFIFLLLPTVNLLIGLNFLDRFGWLRASPLLFQSISLVGTIMVVTAGIWAAFQNDLARLFGYAVIVEIGFSLLAISLGNRNGAELFASMFLPRLVGFGVWALSLSILLREARSTRFEDMEGIAQRMPFASAGVAVASLALAGLPLLAVYPIRQVLLEEIARTSLVNAVWVLAGMVGMLFSTFRALAVLARGTALPVVNPLPEAGTSPETGLLTGGPIAQGTGFPLETAAPQPTIAVPQAFCETPMQIALLMIGIVTLLAIGLFPQAFLHLMNGLLAAYPQLP
jgi:NADH-quinone oxidoreductase subunit N